MRKVLSFVLVLSLVLGSFGMAFAATPAASDVAGKACEDSVNVLTELGVVSGYVDGTYKPENVVTRAEMATLIVKALGLNDYAVGTPKFTDSKTHWAKGYIAYANSLGIISGRTATTFVPDAIVTYDEAATMLVKALGYEDATLVGAWPTNYVTKAKVLGILDDVQAGATGANRGDVAIMLYQTLDQAIGKVNKDGDWVATATKFDDKGVVKEYDTMLARLGAKPYNNGDAFVVGDSDLDNSNVNIRKHAGAYVTAFQNSDEEIIAIKEVKSDFLTGKFLNNGKFEANNIEYSVAFKSTPVEFENGREGTIADYAKNTTDTFTLAVDVSGKTIKDVYSVMSWKSNDEQIMEKDDIANLKDIEKDQTLLGFDFDLNDDKDIDMASFALNGVTGFDKIAVDNVVYVYVSNDDLITRVDVGTTVVTGTLTKISSDDDYTIAGKTYAMADKGDNEADVKDEVKAYLDFAGDIYKLEKISGDANNYAVVLATEDGDNKLSSANAKLKLFLADGSDKIFSVDASEVPDFVYETTTTGGTKNHWKTAAKADFPTGSVIKYGVDKDGYINAITTTKAIVKDTAEHTNKDINARGYFDGYEVATDAVLFTIDVDGNITTGAIGLDDEDNYGITTAEKVKDTTKVEAIYTIKDGKIAAMVMKGATKDDVYGMFLEVAKDSSDGGAELTMMIDGEVVALEAKKSTIQDGKTWSEKTIYKLDKNSSGVVVDLIDEGIGETVTATVASIKGNVMYAADGTTELGRLGADPVVYKWSDSAEAYKSAGTTDIKNYEKGKVSVYEVKDDGDFLYSIVLLAAKTASGGTETPSGDVIAAGEGVTLKVSSLTDIDKVVKVTVNGAEVDEANFEASFKELVLEKEALEGARNDMGGAVKSVEVKITFKDQAAYTTTIKLAPKAE